MKFQIVCVAAMASIGFCTLSSAQTAREINNQTLGVIINTSDPYSVDVGEYYIEKRKIPAQNVVRVSFDPSVKTMPTAIFKEIKKQVDSALPSSIQAMALTWVQPYRVQAENTSITNAFAFPLEPSEKDPQNGIKVWYSNPYYQSTSMKPYADYRIRPAMLIAASTSSKAKQLIDRGVASDNANPIGTGYVLYTSDAVRSLRVGTSDQNNTAVASQLKSIGSPLGDLKYMDADTLTGAQDVLFYFTGKVRVDNITSNVFLPGAIADHLTSYGGMLTDSSQMSSLAWIDGGATGSFGTVTEPYAIADRFPNINTAMSNYTMGNTLIEAYWKSVKDSALGLFIGEPLARPFSGYGLKVTDSLGNTSGYRAGVPVTLTASAVNFSDTLIQSVKWNLPGNKIAYGNNIEWTPSDADLNGKPYSIFPITAEATFKERADGPDYSVKSKIDGLVFKSTPKIIVAPTADTLKSVVQIGTNLPLMYTVQYNGDSLSSMFRQRCWWSVKGDTAKLNANHPDPWKRDQYACNPKSISNYSTSNGANLKEGGILKLTLHSEYELLPDSSTDTDISLYSKLINWPIFAAGNTKGYEKTTFRPWLVYRKASGPLLTPDMSLFSYKWNIPGATIVSDANSLSPLMSLNGVGTINGTVDITYGDTTKSLPVTLTIYPKPTSAALSVKLVPMGKHAPLPLQVKLTATGLARGDQIGIDKVSLNKSNIDVKNKVLTITTAGDHVVTVYGKTLMGLDLEKDTNISVLPNVAPACSIKQLPSVISTKYVGVPLLATCTDSDGRIRGYQWSIDGVVSKSTSTRLNLTFLKSVGGTNVVKLVGTDDSGATSTVTLQVVQRAN